MEGTRVEEERYLISDAAKIVEVEAHVLRYWEEELELPIGRTELGHRYYTRENIETFQKVKELKEKGLQLKAIRTILKGLEKYQMQQNAPADEKDGESTSEPAEEKNESVQEQPLQVVQENTEKLKHFENLVEGIVDRVVKENNEALEKHIEVTFSREMDYLVHMQEQREEERYRKLDESIRQHQNRQMVAAAKETGWFGRIRKHRKK
ncbi:MerR family transcriptional regulator [Lachnospiraceae bacterium OF09-6]|nr:MerR family transcriptional regulator [Lachnospiraceae bacterium OF09-6]